MRLGFLAPFRQDWFDDYANRHHPTMMKIGMALLAPFIAAMFGFSAYLALFTHEKNRLLTSGVSATGVVQSVDVRQHRSRRGHVSYFTTIAYSFVDQLGHGVSGTATREAAYPYSLSKGDKIEILYDGKNPAQNSPRQGLDHEMSDDQFTSGLLLVCGLYGLLYFPRYRTWQRRRAAYAA